jgi:hypothetical protein
LRLKFGIFPPLSQALLREDLLQDTLTIPDLVNGRAFLIEFIRLSVIMVILVGISGG